MSNKHKVRTMFSYFIKYTRKPLTKEEEILYYNKIKEIKKKYKKSSEEYKKEILPYKREFIFSNLKMVIHITNLFCKKNPLLEKEDLFQIGVLSLDKAIENFEPSKGRFYYYARKVVSNDFKKYTLKKNSILNETINFNEKKWKYFKALEKLEEKSEEINYKNISEILEKQFNLYLNQKKIGELERTLYSEFSLDKPYKNKNKNIKYNNFYEIIENTNAKNPEIEVEKNEIKKYINETIKTKLNTKERIIIEMRYGLNGYQPHTLEEIGKKFGLSKQRINIIEQKCLKKLKIHFNKLK